MMLSQMTAVGLAAALAAGLVALGSIPMMLVGFRVGPRFALLGWLWATAFVYGAALLSVELAAAAF